jgi:type IV secretory pathway VirB10-like protein
LGFFTQAEAGIVELAATGVGSFDEEERRRMQRVALGIVASILVHGVLLTAWRGGQPVVPPAPPRPIEVRVQPPPAPPQPRVDTLPPSAPGPAPSAPKARPKPKPRAPVIAVPPDTSRAGEPDPFVVEQQEAPAEPETPRFDPEAAKRTARALANMRDPAKEGTAIGQFPEKPLETESRAARAIKAAKRRDCKDGIPGGLLAPLLLLADKKDSGCKW